MRETNKGEMEIRIKTLPDADWEKVQESVEKVREEYPEAEIYVEWTI